MKLVKIIGQTLESFNECMHASEQESLEKQQKRNHQRQEEECLGISYER